MTTIMTTLLDEQFDVTVMIIRLAVGLDADDCGLARGEVGHRNASICGVFGRYDQG